MRSEFSRQRNEKKMLQEQEHSTASIDDGSGQHLLCLGERVLQDQSSAPAVQCRGVENKPSVGTCKGLCIPGEVWASYVPWMVLIGGWKVAGEVGGPETRSPARKLL